VQLSCQWNKAGFTEPGGVPVSQKGQVSAGETQGIDHKESGGYDERVKKRKPAWSKKPFPTVDVIIEIEREDGRPGIVLIERKNPPFGWALPGGFVEYGESLEQAVAREAKEETSLDLENLEQLHTYSDPGRDPRFHTITTVYTATAKGRPQAKDDAKNIAVFTIEDRPRPLAFDHDRIIEDYLRKKRGRSAA